MQLRFRPAATALWLFVAAVCARLGVWQIHRYGESQALSEAMLQAFHQPPVEGLGVDVDGLAHRQVRLRGVWAQQPPALISGGVVGGQPGHRLIAVLDQADGPSVLVDRGWVPVSMSADALRALQEPGEVVIDGLLLPLDAPVPGEAAAPAEALVGADGVRRWPLRSDLAWGLFPRVLGPPWRAMIAASARPLAPAAVVVGPPLEHEADRRPGPPPVPGYVLPLPRTHHLSYAAQWFGFAALALLVLAWVSRADDGERFAMNDWITHNMVAFWAVLVVFGGVVGWYTLADVYGGPGALTAGLIGGMGSALILSINRYIGGDDVEDDGPRG